jgi:hypothetical protein
VQYATVRFRADGPSAPAAHQDREETDLNVATNEIDDRIRGAHRILEPSRMVFQHRVGTEAAHQG